MYNLPTNYNNIRKEGERLFLINEADFNAGRRQLDEMQSAFDSVRELLRKHDLPTTEAWIRSVADSGSEGLRLCVIKETEEKIKDMGLPGYIAASVKKAAPQEIPAIVWDEADAAKLAIESAAGKLPFIVPNSYDDARGIIIDKEEAQGELMKRTRIEISPEMQAAAEVVATLSRQLRELELAGVNGRQIVCRYAAEHDLPDDAARYNDIVFARHQPGQIAPLAITPIASKTPSF